MDHMHAAMQARGGAWHSVVITYLNKGVAKRSILESQFHAHLRCVSILIVAVPKTCQCALSLIKNLKLVTTDNTAFFFFSASHAVSWGRVTSLRPDTWLASNRRKPSATPANPFGTTSTLTGYQKKKEIRQGEKVKMYGGDDSLP